ncbi:hypothetical protein chiPu_0021744 [Chiloscyllium punctatum]|uniref:Uncharacterized protein n=1 Tax=Chiloscyllium punctatum TaxID=137246 RepID=A0A401RLG5_CHIPU|nr:hypothetical protein [Chiloscyllium punctatum]
MQETYSLLTVKIRIHIDRLQPRAARRRWWAVGLQKEGGDTLPSLGCPLTGILARWEGGVVRAGEEPSIKGSQGPPGTICDGAELWLWWNSYVPICNVSVFLSWLTVVNSYTINIGSPSPVSLLDRVVNSYTINIGNTTQASLPDTVHGERGLGGGGGIEKRPSGGAADPMARVASFCCGALDQETLTGIRMWIRSGSLEQAEIRALHVRAVPTAGSTFPVLSPQNPATFDDNRERKAMSSEASPYRTGPPRGESTCRAPPEKGSPL